MEEMNNLEMNQEVTEAIAVATEKLTLGQNILAYGIATVFGIGVITIGYGGYKGGKALVGKIRSKKEKAVEAVDDVEDDIEDIHDVEYNEAE